MRAAKILKRPGLWLLLVLAVGSALWAQPPRTEKPRTRILPNAPRYTGEVSVAFWNLEWFPGGPVAAAKISEQAIQNHLDAVTAILDEENPTIFIAAEVRNLSGAMRLNRNLRRPYPYVAVTDYQAENDKARESDANRQEHALFSRIAWREVWEVDFVGSLPPADDRPARGYIGATFLIDGEPLTIFGVHPKSNYMRPGEREPELTALKNVEKRERASRYLLEDIRRRGLDPLLDKIIVMGDFNTDLYAERFQGEKSLKMILHAGFYSNFDQLEPAARVTIPAKLGEPWPDSVFDYILSSVALGPLPVRVIQRGASRDAARSAGSPGHASDHYMIKAVLPLRARPQAELAAANPGRALPAGAPAPAAVREPATTPEPATAPEPATVDFVELARNRALWPREVALTERLTVPVVVGGRQYGTAELPVGTRVRLVEVLGEEIKIMHGETTVVVPARATDLEARLPASRGKSSTTPAVPAK
jgi:endonuclease/exonuclease/phosphatase family metal-dependent hydrolase